MTTRLVPATRKPQREERSPPMTFKPTKCWINASSDGHVLSSPDGTLAGVLTKNSPNALLVPLVPGMEAVVRAHLAAKPKPAKKPAKKGPKPPARAGKGGRKQ